MLDCIANLDRVASALAEVVDAGLLEELKLSIAERLRGRPRSDFEAIPGLQFDVEQLAALLAEFTGMPLALCEMAALDQLLPGNRRRTAIDTLMEFADKLREKDSQQRASTIIAAERRRLAR